MGGQRVESSRDLSRTIAGVPVGKEVGIKVLRDGKERTFRIKIAKRTDDKEAVAVKGSGERTDLGMTVALLTPQLARQFNISETEGVVVVGVEEGSPADKAEVNEGDVIVEIDHKPIKTLDDYNRQIQKVKKGDTASLLVRRRAGFVALNITK